MKIKNLTILIVILLVIPFTFGADPFDPECECDTTQDCGLLETCMGDPTCTGLGGYNYGTCEPSGLGHTCNEYDLSNCQQKISSTRSGISSTIVILNEQLDAIKGESTTGIGVYGTGEYGVYGEGAPYGLYTNKNIHNGGNKIRFGNPEADNAWFISNDEAITMGFDVNKNTLIKNKLYLTNGQICQGEPGSATCYSLSDLEGENYWAQSGNNIYYLTGNIGVNTNNPTEKVHVEGDTQTSNLITNSIIYDSNEIEIGLDAQATGSNSIALGAHSIANGINSLGIKSTGASGGASGENSIAIGDLSNADGENSIAIRASSNAEKDNCVAIKGSCDGIYSTALSGATESGYNVQYGVHTYASYSTSIGKNTEVRGEGSIGVNLWGNTNPTQFNNIFQLSGGQLVVGHEADTNSNNYANTLQIIKKTNTNLPACNEDNQGTVAYHRSNSNCGNLKLCSCFTTGEGLESCSWTTIG